MNRFVGLLPGLFLALSLSAQAPQEVLTQLRIDLVYLSSDYLEGREAGKAGEILAAEYIASRFSEIGLKPMGDQGGYFQVFDFTFNPNPHGAPGANAEARKGRNVAGYLDNRAPNTVVIGAHFDHLGQGIPGSLNTGDPGIHNGADDNASGVSAMLRLAEHLKKSKAARKNNYLFLAFSAEELGLFGSKYFVNHPTIDLSKVNYMINMDMVGRLNAEKVLVINGVGTSPVWKEVLPGIQAGGISIKTTESGVGPSDHTSFYLQNIPAIHFFTGQHQEYHKPVDDAGLINFEGLHAVTDFIITLIERIDGRGKIAFTKTKDEEQGRQASRFKVSLGVMPDYTYQGEGMRVDGVVDGRPAAKAGLQKGDVILKLGAQEVKDIYSYMDGLGKLNAGEKVVIVFKRGEEMMEKEVGL